MIKKVIPFAAMALIMTSCMSDTKDSTQTIPFTEYNLIVDNQDAAQPAQASICVYTMKNNITQGVVDIKANDVIINNQKLSFETDTMRIYSKPFNVSNVQGGGSAINYTFSKNGNAATGSAVTGLTGTLVWNFLSSSNNLLNPDYTLTVGQRLDLSYTLNDRYSVRTFWPTALFIGSTVASEGAASYSTKAGHYLADIDFEKKIARVYVYNAEFSADKDQVLPRVIRFEEIPVVFNHYGFSLESESPKTTVLGEKDNTITMVESAKYNASDFKMEFMSFDMTDASVSYKMDGKNIAFHGSSILK